MTAQNVILNRLLDKCDILPPPTLCVEAVGVCHQLQNLIPALQPMRMSGEFVERFHEYGLARSETYLSQLQTELNQGNYGLFRDAVAKILQYGVTIEQEIFLNEFAQD